MKRRRASWARREASGSTRSTCSARHRDRYRVFALAARGNDASCASNVCSIVRASPCWRTTRPPRCSRASCTAPARRHEVLAASRRSTDRAHAATSTWSWPRSSALPGSPSTLAAARAGKRLLLANKEALVHVRPAAHRGRTARRGDADLRSTASTTRSSSACRRRSGAGGVRRILLTASGGPFLRTAARRLARRDARPGVRASALGHGPQDLGRFGDADEQGPGADRGLPAVRR